jgi:serine/threonine protein kinase HipA of HipAB toxin-antitoxin module
MVNLLREFAHQHKRPPTEREIASMMTMKREQEKWKRNTLAKKKFVAEKLAGKNPKQQSTINTNAPHYRWPKKATKIALRINRALLRQTTIENIAYIEGVTQTRILQEMERWKLPQLMPDE